MKCPNDTIGLMVEVAVGGMRTITDEFGGMTLSCAVVGCGEAGWCSDWIRMDSFLASSGGIVWPTV